MASAKSQKLANAGAGAGALIIGLVATDQYRCGRMLSSRFHAPHGDWPSALVADEQETESSGGARAIVNPE